MRILVLVLLVMITIIITSCLTGHLDNLKNLFLFIFMPKRFSEMAIREYIKIDHNEERFKQEEAYKETKLKEYKQKVLEKPSNLKNVFGNQ